MLNSVQLLRLIAALSVVLAHMPQWAMPAGNFANCSRDVPICGSIGVDLFFCISGFLMALTTANREPGIRNALGFATRRLLRIWPLYALITVAYMSVNSVELHWYWKWLIFAPHLDPSTGFRDPPLSAGWTLHFEMYFYALTAICMLLPWKTKAAAVAVTLLGCASLLIDNTIYFTASVIVEFAFGIALGLLWQQRALWKRITAWRLPLIASSTIILLLAAHASDWPHSPGLSAPRMEVLNYYTDQLLPRFVGWGVPTALFTLSVLLFEDKIPVRAGALGDYTYSIYLLHLPAIYAAEWVSKTLSVELHGQLVTFGVYPLGIIATTFLGAFFTYHLVERPTQNLGGKIAKMIEAPQRAYQPSANADSGLA